MSNEHPLNVKSNKVNGRKDLLKYGKIHTLLNDMESDAAENIREAESNLLNFYRRLWMREYKNLGTAYVEGRVYGGVDEIVSAYQKHMEVSADKQRSEELTSLLKVQRDAFTLARGIRRFAPFIEAGAMTIAEAISCEIQKNAGKHSEEKK